MSKELEMVRAMINGANEYEKKTGDKNPPVYFSKNNLLIIEQALQRLEAIYNANPSEALKDLEEIKSQSPVCHYDDGSKSYVFEKEFNTIKQALLKAQELEKEVVSPNSVNLLMQELDCKDFAELRKYARCGYEKINNFKGSKEVKIEIPESSLMDYNPVKQYLKWEDLEFKEDNETKIKVRMGEHIYDLWYGSYKTGYGIFKQKCSLAGYEFDEDYDIDIFNDLHLERVEE